MSSADKNLSHFSTSQLPDISNKSFGILVAEWNEDITENLYQGTLQTLLKHGAKKENVYRCNVPGAYELSFGAQRMAEHPRIEAVICLGCIIKGETKHDEYIAHAVAQGLTNVSLKYNKPVIFGVLTPNTHQQAVDRSGGLHGNKGDEAAMTAIKMIAPVNLP